MPRRKPKPTLSPIQIAEKEISERHRLGRGVSTAERLLKTGSKIDVAKPTVHHPLGVQRVMDWPVERLWKEGLLDGTGGDKSERQTVAGVRRRAAEDLNAAWVGSGLGGIYRSVDLLGVGGGGDRIPIPEFQQQRRDEYYRMTKALGRDRIARVTHLIVCDEIPPAEAAAQVTERKNETALRAIAIEYLKDGLDRLANRG